MSSCATTSATPEDFAEAGRAAGETAAANVSIDIGPQPVECWQEVAHAPLIEGEEIISILKRERAQLDRSNKEKIGCAETNEQKRQNLLNRTAQPQ